MSDLKSQNSEIDLNRSYNQHMIIGTGFTVGGVGLISAAFFENAKHYSYSNDIERSLNDSKQHSKTVFLAASGGICLTVGILNVFKAIDISKDKKLNVTAGSNGVGLRYRF